MFTSSPSGLLLPKGARASSPNAARGNNVAKIGSLAIWAKNGSVCMSKELPSGEEEYDQVNTKDAKARLDALGEITAAMRKAPRPPYDAIRLNERFMSAYEQVIRQAEEQGPYEYEDMRKDRARRRAVQVSVPTPEVLKEHAGE